jgi:hypothetical protein
MEVAMMHRRVPICLALALLIASCSSGSESGDIAFEHELDGPTGTSAWTASGEAIDSSLLCPTATGMLEGFEDEDGNPRTPPEIEALFEIADPFVSVSVESMTCDDGSGDFTLRFINDLDPTITDGEPVVAATWTITGGSGLDTTEGDGDSGPPQPSAQGFVYSATGIITNG